MFAPPTKLPSPEDRLRPRTQLWPTFAHRRRADYRHRNSGERAFTGGKHQLLSGVASTEQVRAQISHLRGGRARRRTDSDSALSSGQSSVTGGQQVTGTPPPARAIFVGGGQSPGGLVQKFFNILDTFPFTNYTYRGIIICIQPKLKNFVK